MSTETLKKEYLAAIGRRKTATAVVRLYPSSKASFSLNGKDLKDYFKTESLQRIASEAFSTSKADGFYEVKATIKGGGSVSQAEALRHGISRALLLADSELRKKLKKAGFLKRDPRVKERRKFGLKKARKAPQWSKR
ncbi:MAG: 30S ribosomal protein S9 [Candidatus Taylorbacteria bacterium RIFCSPLOWO2_02_FULL_43_11]|uniref:Small ribosomal subunit protein uS9 n=1 Tax=Candidatus Taylorbacteria bacterium RIFCSPHIGHO2_02_FULL_43_32b TaxID=1802306 RepID=A0A1G2MED2_9BACT|nr:MAG: 30S ribosomal protein S9 [Candidatus Taylorbacteria bacterium RIFCSPHIGHO2_01_FULL_43_47]OHA22256.1 MAG: 30S ribosomal protein S9 [Candidatus Taylorbacteria bacterium RIFCSPHIGHO2_02_FULL_43_32b]OHA29609.1 MAG: 30S ribosomal protein S9 [Candidatus Taylorbacteria bacterium RIFCSPLOWO2_01_FULL_43_44]OHA36141.1 MAG: 30S ribosomal protein S9 [Candidatus Taylorbacteria bacterium RIFCSPLOWO2_02_FULL_43_11]